MVIGLRGWTRVHACERTHPLLLEQALMLGEGVAVLEAARPRVRLLAWLTS